jgi:hypothetical protein
MHILSTLRRPGVCRSALTSYCIGLESIEECVRIEDFSQTFTIIET